MPEQDKPTLYLPPPIGKQNTHSPIILPSNRFYIERDFFIKDKRGIKRRFKYNAAQDYYWKHRKLKNLIIKSRQKGLTKVIDADQLMDCIRKSTNAVVISHEREATQRLFGAVKYYVDNLEKKPTVDIDSKSEMRFPRMESTYFIGTAGQRAFGRGDTLHRVHLSEAAFYQNFGQILNGIQEAAEYGQIDIETSPNGREEVYDMYMKAKAGRSSYTPIFIPWFMGNEYSVESMTQKEREGLSPSVFEMINIPDDQFELTKEERDLVRRVLHEWNIQLTVGMIKWRRYKIWDKGQLFFQEYPEDDVSCFLQSGRSVFTQITTDPTKRIPLDSFDIWPAREEFKKSLKSRVLYAAVDGAEGVQNGDSHCFSVIDVRNGKAYVVFEYVSTEPIEIFWSRIAPIIKAFRMRLGIEKNGIGLAHVMKAKQLGIVHKPWVTSSANRPVMITDLEEAYRKGDLIETYSEAEDEARNLIYDGHNRIDHPEGKHDDRVMSRAIAYQMRKKPLARVTFL